LQHKGKRPIPHSQLEVDGRHELRDRHRAPRPGWQGSRGRPEFLYRGGRASARRAVAGRLQSEEATRPRGRIRRETALPSPPAAGLLSQTYQYGDTSAHHFAHEFLRDRTCGPPFRDLSPGR
jgi:hypothetical protein